MREKRGKKNFHRWGGEIKMKVLFKIKESLNLLLTGKRFKYDKHWR
jgi:hypothetical protein